MTKRKPKDTQPEPTVFVVTCIKEGPAWRSYSFHLPESVAVRHMTSSGEGDLRAIAQSQALAMLDQHCEDQIA